MTIILPTHLPSIYLLLATVLACFLAGSTPQHCGRLLSAIVLPVGTIGTFVGFISILSSMEDPSHLVAAVTSTLPTALYAAILKIAVDVYAPAPLPPDESSNSKQTRLAAIVGLGAFLGFSFQTVGALFLIVDFGVFGVLGFSAIIIVGLNKLAGNSTTAAGVLVETLPKVGLLGLVYSVFALPLAMSDPTRVGPFMAFGLLIHVYANLFAVTFKLARPELSSAESPVAHWLHWSAALGCIGAYFGSLLILTG
ncbi:MAG: hypothetical protein OSB21_07390 [Myxococcota bacterium]|nr:hypothetical protein [Myxococcota bacterium]